jgi:hypothetical protein
LRWACIGWPALGEDQQGFEHSICPGAVGYELLRQRSNAPVIKKDVHSYPGVVHDPFKIGAFQRWAK